MVVVIQGEGVIFFNRKSSIENLKFGCGSAALSSLRLCDEDFVLALVFLTQFFYQFQIAKGTAVALVEFVDFVFEVFPIL